VDLSTVLTEDLQELTKALDRPQLSDIELTRSLLLLERDAFAAVRSFLGVSITLNLDGQDVTLTSLSVPVEPHDIRSSLQLPLGAIAPDLEGVVTLYASRAMAFTDFAEQLRSSLGSRAREILLDQSVGRDVSSGLSGAAEMSAVNRAVGVLIDRGHSPASARTYLQELADTEGLLLHQAAERVLDSV
jgi:hypothetical protein